MPNLSLPIAAAHPVPPVGSVTSPLTPAATDLVNPTKAPASPHTTNLSFAFDRETKSLRVVITDPLSGEVLRKIEYTSIPPQTHRSDKLQGLLLDQRA